MKKALTEVLRRFAARVRERHLVRILLLATACSEQPLLGPATPVTPTAQQAPASFDRPAEAEFRAIAATSPSFGGFYLDSAAHLITWVADSSQFDRARSAVSKLIQRRPFSFRGRHVVPTVLLRRGQYSFLDLARWRDSITEHVLMAGLDGVIGNDVDERSNRVMVRLRLGAGDDVKSTVEAKLREVHVPLAAVRFEYSDVHNVGGAAYEHGKTINRSRMFNSGTLRDYQMPIVGGMGIKRVGYNRSDYMCTGGFVAQVNGIRYLVTNSHCTSAMYLGDGDVFQQPNTTQRIGAEAWDAHGWMCGSVICRRSDAAFIRLDDTVRATRGAIAHTLWRLNNDDSDVPQSITFDYSLPVFSVSQTTIPSAGEYVDKVGARSGWSWGQINTTCEDFFVEGYMRLCQFSASYWDDGGDSGSPVFFFPFSSSFVYLEGINWGSGRDAFNRHYAMFSPISGIEQDFGLPPGGLVVTSEVTLTSPAPLTGEICTAGCYVANTPLIYWNAATASNSPDPVQYRVMRRAYDAYTGQLSNWALLGIASDIMNWNDTEYPVIEYLGSTAPSPYYSYVQYRIDAYNMGVMNSTGDVYFVTNHGNGSCC